MYCTYIVGVANSDPPCKFCHRYLLLLPFQGTSIFVSTLSITSIALDRRQLIVCPHKSAPGIRAMLACVPGKKEEEGEEDQGLDSEWNAKLVHARRGKYWDFQRTK